MDSDMLDFTKERGRLRPLNYLLRTTLKTASFSSMKLRHRFIHVHSVD